MKRSICFGLALFFTVVLPAQYVRYLHPLWSVRGNVQHGIMLPEYGFMSLISDSYVNSFELNICKEAEGKTIWPRLYRFPSFGVSFYYTTMGSHEQLGEQYSLYPYYSLNIIRRKNFEFNYQMGVGVSYATKKYAPDQNYQNLAIGSHFNIHYHADLIAQYRLPNNVLLNGGIAFSHISNANLSEPNVGINITALYAGVGFAFGKTDSVRGIVNGDSYGYHLSYEVMLAGGMKHTRTFESFQYPAVSLSFDTKWRFGYKFGLSAGIDVFYDSSTEPQMNRLHMDYSPSDSYTSGIHIAQQFYYDRFSLIVQEGVYIGLTDHLNGYHLYNRAIVRYQFSKHFFVNFSMKTHLYILDFPELGIGYTWQPWSYTGK